MIRHFVHLLALFLFAGCAAPNPAPPSQTAQSVSAAPAPECVREYHAGSLMPTTHCSLPKTDAERQQMIDDLQKQLPPGGNKATAGGG